MSERRIVMRVEVIWISPDSNETVEKAFRHWDGTDLPSPVEYVAGALKMAWPDFDWSAPVDGGGFEIRVDGPDKWSAAFDNDA